MAQVFLSLGSNIEREKNIAGCLRLLQQAFSEFSASSVYESEAVGFDGDNFYNLVVGIHTDLPLGELAQYCRKVEDAFGRDRSEAKFGPRSLDIDILTYDNLLGTYDGIQLPRAEILENAFVLQPLAELAPQHVHPGTQQTYQVLWQQFNKPEQVLWVVPFGIDNIE